MVIRLLLVTMPLDAFLLQTNLVLQLLYFYRVPVGRKNRQKDDQTCSAGLGGGKSSTELWSREVRRQRKFKAFANLEQTSLFTDKTLLQKSIFAAREGGKRYTHNRS